MALTQWLYGVEAVSKNIFQPPSLRDLDANTRLSSYREIFQCFLNLTSNLSALITYSHFFLFIQAQLTYNYKLSYLTSYDSICLQW